MPWRAEVGLRILTAAAIRSGGRFERGVRPVLSVSQGHWMRVFLHVTDGRDHADKATRALGAVWGDEARMAHTGDRAPEGPWAGDLYLGPLHDRSLTDALTLKDGMHARTQKLLPILQAEAGMPAFWAAMPQMRRVSDNDMPRKAVLFERIKEAGYLAGPTHMDPEGVRTDAPWSALRPLLSPQGL